MTSRKSHIDILIASMNPQIHIFQIKLPSFAQFTTVILFFGTTTNRWWTIARATATAATTAVIIGGVIVGGITISTATTLSFWTWSCDSSYWCDVQTRNKSQSSSKSDRERITRRINQYVQTSNHLFCHGGLEYNILYVKCHHHHRGWYLFFLINAHSFMCAYQHGRISMHLDQEV